MITCHMHAMRWMQHVSLVTKSSARRQYKRTQTNNTGTTLNSSMHIACWWHTCTAWRQMDRRQQRESIRTAWATHAKHNAVELGGTRCIHPRRRLIDTDVVICCDRTSVRPSSPTQPSNFQSTTYRIGQTYYSQFVRRVLVVKRANALEQFSARFQCVQ